MACEPDVALFRTASSSLACRQILADISSKHCKTVNTSRTAFQSYCWLSSGVIELNRALAMAIHQYPILWLSWKYILKCETSMALLAKKVPNPKF